MALFPLSRILNCAKLGYVLCKNKLSHLSYIDNLKLYAQNEEELRHALQIVEDFGKDINMSFGLNKCAILSITNRKYATTNICPDIPKLDDNKNKDYCYLEIMEDVDFHMKEVKELTMKDCISQVCKILNADMNGDYMMTAICAQAIPELRHAFRIMKWTKGELRKLDVKTQKMLTMEGIHHPKGNVYCLYLHMSKGRRGLVGVEDTHNCKYAALAKYVLNGTNMLTQMICMTTTPMQKFLLK
eukprot:10854605-Ditylum_brightwellii.AAC.1